MNNNKSAGNDPSSDNPGISRREILSTFGGLLAASAVSFPGYAKAAGPAQSVETDLHFLPLSVVAGQIRSGKLSPVELTEKLIDRIKRIDGRLHSYVTLTEDRALAGARAAEKEIRSGRYRGPLHGIPVGIKDLLFTAGIPTMAGTMALKDFVPDHNATVVERLNKAGAVMLGKNTLCEGAMGPYHPDLKVPVNPWNADRWTGVSSSGSGVAVAAGLCFVSIGSDTGGSIRYPSAANGCVGLKPTFGRVSLYGVIPLAESMDHIGPMTRTVEDAAIVFDAIAGYDENDPTSRLEPVEAVTPQLKKGISGMRIGFDERYSTEGVEPELAVALRKAAKQLESLGAKIVEVKMPYLSKTNEAWWNVSTAEAAAYHFLTYTSRRDAFGPGFLDVLDYGAKLSGVEYAKSRKIGAEVKGNVNAFLSTVDCMICPSMSNSAQARLKDPFMPETEESWKRNVINDVHTKPFNFAGAPTLSVPCGFSSDGMPFSLQFVGRPLSEAVICRAGYAYEQSTNWHTMHPKI